MSTSRKSEEGTFQQGSKRRVRRETIDFTELKEFANSVRKNIDDSFKLDTKGTSSNIPQVFTSNLFTVAPVSKKAATDEFMNLAMLKTQTNSSNNQIGEVKNLLSVIGKKKEGLNLEAGSYMATLEYTMRSISGMKDLL